MATKVTMWQAAQIAYDAAVDVGGTEFQGKWELLRGEERDVYIGKVNRAWISGVDLLAPPETCSEDDDNFRGRPMPTLFDTVFAAVVKALR